MYFQHFVQPITLSKSRQSSLVIQFKSNFYSPPDESYFAVELTFHSGIYEALLGKRFAAFFPHRGSSVSTRRVFSSEFMTDNGAIVYVAIKDFKNCFGTSPALIRNCDMRLVARTHFDLLRHSRIRV